MSAEAAVLTRSWKVGPREVSLSCPRPEPGKAIHLAMIWSPGPPKRLSDAEWAQYRAGRDAALRELCAELGIKGLVVEV